MGWFSGISLDYPLGKNSTPSNFFGGVSNTVGNMAMGLLGSKPPTPQTPPAPPNPSASVNSALQLQLQQELQMRRSSMLQAGGEGGVGVLQDPNVKSAGQLLLGSY